MKIRIADRLLAALAGIVLLALCAGIIAQYFFNVPVLDFAGKYMANKDGMLIPVIATCVGLFLVGLYCFMILFRHRKTAGFVMQQTDSGELAISLKAMEGLVLKCVDLHPEMKLENIKVEAEKEGVLVRLKIGLASGVSIPLAVGALQKQIKQYLTTCSGVEVKEVRVQVETAAGISTSSPYDVPELTGATSAALPKASAEENAEEAVEKKPEAEPAKDEAAEPVAEEKKEEETSADVPADFILNVEDSEESNLKPEAFENEGEI